ncbi:bone morphogenetic protein 8A-like [Ischnura elegans]|uniref:bone morphogenetic protein 8A-like n=1 Tax=Ischnura elegans TaxID=197161 RepID=UPI001ED87069|nr:bone morphogenetic protein 8A-like [Ischnura elegans]
MGFAKDFFNDREQRVYWMELARILFKLPQVRVYQRLSRSDASAFPVDSHRLLAVQHVAAATTMATPASGARSWHVVNVRAAVEDWLTARRPNLGFLVDVVTGDGRPPASLQRVKFDRRVSGKNSRGKEPALIVLTHDGPTLGRQAPLGVLRRRWRSVIEGVTTRGRRNSATIPPLETAGNSSGCGLRDLWVDFGALRLSKWIASPRGFNSGQCAGGCAPEGEVETTSHAALLRALRRLGRPRSAPPPACTPSALHPLTLLACVANHCTLKVLEDLVAASCGCH